MSTPKSGFEIRADLLKQAQELLQDNNYRKIDYYHAQVSRAMDEKDVNYPDYPMECLSGINSADIIIVAKQFNEFVNEK